MKRILALVGLFFVPTAQASKPDCIYTGRGEVYDFAGNHLKEKSFDLYLERFSSGGGLYVFHETKTFPDGKKTNLDFQLAWNVGKFSTDNGAGRVVKGLCIKEGYCVGKNEFTDFKGTFVTRFDKYSILTTTTTDSLIVDEMVRPKNSRSCIFR